ncbi:MAG: hypothetical protein ACQEWM_13115 [Actinomycetota bacterium]
MRPRLVVATVIASLLGAVLTVVAPVGVADEATAATASDFDPGHIVSDDQFFDGGAMTAAQVQAFIDVKHPGCTAGYTCLDTYRQGTPSMAADAYCAALPGRTSETAASIIARVGAACDISQRFLLVLLEKEQSLVTHRSPNATRYTKATGFGCPDTAPCDSSVGGFFYQVYYGARQFQRYAAHPGNYNHRAGVVNNVLYNPNAACGSSPVLIRNTATAGLYNYTPYQPNAAALRNLYGTGDACSAYGNRNTWRMWTDWFGSPTAVAGGAFARDSSNGRIFLVSGGRKYYVPSTAILAEYRQLGSAQDRTSAALAAIPSGPDLGRTVRASNGAVYLVDNSQLLHFQSCTQMAAWKLQCGDMPTLEAGHEARMLKMGALNDLVSTDDGGHWLVQSGTRRQLTDPQRVAAFGYREAPSRLDAAVIASIPIGHPVVAAGDVVRSGNWLQNRVVSSNGRVYTSHPSHVGLEFLWFAPKFEDRSIALMPATAGALPDRFRDSAGSWVLTTGGAMRVDPQHYGGPAYFTPVADALGATVSSAGAPVGPHFARPYGSSTTYLMSHGYAEAVSATTMAWYSRTYAIPAKVWEVSRNAIDAVPTRSSYADGTLVRGPSGAVYLMDGGNGIHVASMDFVTALGLPTRITEVSSGIINGLASRQGVLNSAGVRIGQTSYVAVNGSLHPFASNAAKTAWGLREITLSSLGSTLTISTQAATHLVYDAAGRTYLLEAGKRRYIDSGATFAAVGGNSTTRLLLPTALMQRIPEGQWVRPVYTPGSLVTTEGRGEVWMADGDRLLHLGDFATARSMGLPTASTRVPNEAIAAYPTAAKLPSSLLLCGTTAYAAVGGSLRPMAADVRALYPAAAFTQLSTGTCERLSVSTTPMSPFIRGADGRVYYVESGVRHWLGGPALTRLNGWNRIVDVDRTIITAIPAGATWSN